MAASHHSLARKPNASVRRPRTGNSATTLIVSSGPSGSAELSLAARRDPSIDAEIGFVHPKGVWVGNEEVNEMTVFAGKSDMAITLLLYPNNGANYLRLMPDCDEEDTLDRYDQIQRHA